MFEQIQLGVSQGLGTFITMTLEYTQKPKKLTYWSTPPPKKKKEIAVHTGSTLEAGLREYQDLVGWVSQDSPPGRGGPQIPSSCHWLFTCYLPAEELNDSYSQSLKV